MTEAIAATETTEATATETDVPVVETDDIADVGETERDAEDDSE